MGIFSDVTGAVLSKAGGSGGADDQHNLLSGVLALLNHPEVGGLSGLLEKFKAAGMGPIVEQWVAQGPNPPVTGEQVQQALPADAIGSLAAKLGVDPQVASAQIAKYLPGVVDHLTPDGTVPEGGLGAFSSIFSSLKERFFGGAELPRNPK